MFERRLRILLLLLALPFVAVVLRLLQLQVVNGAVYRDETRKLLLSPVQYFPCLRGEILDHDGQHRLAYDAPAWNISIDYPLLAREEKYMHDLAVRRYRGKEPEVAQAALEQDIDAAYSIIAEISGETVAEIHEAAARELRAVLRVKQAVEKRRGVQTTIEQETVPLPLVRGLDRDRQSVARDRLKPFEWVTIVADQKRVYEGGPSVGHLIGLSQVPQLGEVDADDVAQKHYSEAPLGELYEYVPGDLKGVSGVEALGERWLRGHRGRQRKDITGKIVDDPPPAEAQDGKALRLTIDLPLQQRVYEILKSHVELVDKSAGGKRVYPYSTGGAAVILDVPSREVLAIVSYPGCDPNVSREDWAKLLEDELHQPLSFRPLQMRYPPGSSVKPMLLAAALTDGTISPNTHVNCQKHLFPANPEWGWGCMFAHGDVDPLKAIQHSCNIFFYTLGAKVGTPRLSYWMSQFGLGRDSGTGFPQEADGSLAKTRNEGTARLAGIGQSEVDATPIQVANMFATIASGVYRPVTLCADDPRPRPAVRLPITNAAWNMAREGMYLAVNQEGGTAFRRGRLTGVGDYILVGKTGSATANRRKQYFYTCHLKDGTSLEDAAWSKRELERKYPGSTVVRTDKLASTIPPEDVDPTHAWFGGYVTTRQHYRDSNNGGKLNVAIAVIIEYAGHGGEAAAPAALEMIKVVLERQGEIVPPAEEELQ